MKRDRRQEWRDIFTTVIEAYQEVKSSHGTLGSMDYEQALSGTTSGGRCTKIVKPSLSDYVCDVEIAARAALQDRPADYQFFRDHYLIHSKRDAILTNAEAQREQSRSFGLTDKPTIPNNEMNQRVQERVGRKFKARRLWPLSVYMRAKDVR